MSNITLPAYFDNPAEIGGQLRRTVDDDLTAAAELIFEFDPILHYDLRLPNFNVYQASLFNACFPYYGLIDGEAFLLKQSVSAPNWSKVFKALISQAGLKGDPKLVLLSSLSRFLAAYFRSDYVCWREMISVELIQRSKESNGWQQRNKLTYTGKGKKGTVYWFARYDDGGEESGTENYLGSPIYLNFQIPPDPPDPPWADPKAQTLTFYKTCIHIEEF